MLTLILTDVLVYNLNTVAVPFQQGTCEEPIRYQTKESRFFII